MSRILFVTDVNKTMLISGGFVTFGPMWLSALLQKDGHQCYLSGINYKEAEKVFLDFKPDIVAYTAFTGAHKEMAAMNRELKKRFNFYSMFGGPHATFSPEVLEEEDGLDAICMGEGFEALPEFINKLEKGEDITNVQNFWVKADNKIYKNSYRPLLKNLDVLPFPDRSLYNKYKFFRWAKTSTVMTGLGCPFKCTYCFNHQLHKMRLKGDAIHRQRSVDVVIAEIKALRKEYPQTEYLIFRDDILMINKEWSREFAEKYSREIGLPFYCLMRPEIINEEIADYLKQAGCYYVGVGIESGNDYLRNEVLKRPMSKEQIENGMRILHDRKLKFSMYNIIGIPGETMETAMETWELNVKCKPTFGDSFALTPYPKTEIYKYAVANGFFDPNTEYPMTYHDNLLINLKDKRRIENFHYLFGLSVEFPAMMPLIKVLIKLPLGPAYNTARKMWKGYCFRHRIYPYKISLKHTALTLFDQLFVSEA